MKIKINDPFGFTKAINFKKLDDPKVIKELSNLFNIDKPNEVYKKSVNQLKKWRKKWTIKNGSMILAKFF